jgi:hypothetical protein
MIIELYQTKKKIANITPVPWLDALNPRDFGVTGSPVNPEEQRKADRGVRHRVAICTDALGTGFFLAFDAGSDTKRSAGRQQYLRIVDGVITRTWATFAEFTQARCLTEIDSLPVLTGTEAQVKWASKIQQEALLRIMEANDRKLDFPSSEAGSLIYIKSAKWWIDHRDSVVSEALALIALRSTVVSPLLLSSLPPLAAQAPATLPFAEERRMQVLRSLLKTKANTPTLKRIVDVTTAIALGGLRDAGWWIETRLEEAVEQIQSLRVEAFKELLVPAESWKMMPDGGYAPGQEDWGQPIAIAKAPDGSYHLFIDELGF